MRFNADTRLYIFCFGHPAANTYGYFRADGSQSEDIVNRFIRIYDSLGMVLKCESKCVKFRNTNAMKMENLLIITKQFRFVSLSFREFGVTIILLIVSCLFQLILSLYYIFTAVVTADVLIHIT